MVDLVETYDIYGLVNGYVIYKDGEFAGTADRHSEDPYGNAKTWLVVTPKTQFIATSKQEIIEHFE